MINPKIEFTFISSEEFWPIYEKHELELFQNNKTVINQHFSEEENEKLKTLKKNFSIPYQLFLIAKIENEIVGWSWGYQKGFSEYYMCNSAVFPQHRKQRIYTKMLELTVAKATRDGFQEITSKHHASNNAVIIPKLKAGFLISGFEINVRFGTLVTMTYFPNKKIEDIYHQKIGYLHRNP